MPTPDEARAIGHAISALRPKWLATSLATWILNNVPTRPARDVMLALVVAAYDPAVDTPGVLAKPGPWWDAVDAVNRRNDPAPVAAAPDWPYCPLHGARVAPGALCASCEAERKGKHPDRDTVTSDAPPRRPGEPWAAYARRLSRTPTTDPETRTNP